MKRLCRTGYAFSVGTAAAMLAGCGLQAPVAGPTLPQTPAIAPARSAPHRIAPAAAYQQLYRFHPQKVGTHPGAALLDVNGSSVD